VKALLRIFRLSRKLVLIIGGVALLMGCSGAFALYIGRDKLIGPSGVSMNGLKCVDVNLVTIRKNNHVWVRKYITTDATDGVSRIRTALRVAKAVYDAQLPDLVQVVVLDKNGPTLQSDIRGRALGATVVYVPHPDAFADGAVDAPITARYYDGGASDQGMFYGDRVDMSSLNIDHMMADMTDHSDCADPVATEAKDGESGKRTTKKSAEGETKPHGEEKKTEEAAPHSEQPSSAEGEAKPTEGHTGSFVGASSEPPVQTDPATTGASK
jgi:hypothetical protein